MARMDKNHPLHPIEYTKAEILAIQSLQTGTANEGQQQLALAFIITKVCKTHDQPYRPGPDGQRETDLAIGKAHVGKQIVRFTKLPTGNLK